MARETRVTITDDLDGSEGASTYRFSWQSTAYEIDLTDAHRDDMLRSLEPFIAAARKTASSPRRRGASQPQGDRAADIRAWARENGHEVPARGRIPDHIRQAYANR